MPAPKKTAKPKAKVKDLKTKKNPKGGVDIIAIRTYKINPGAYPKIVGP